MQSRLIGLGGKAETVRSRVPEEYAPAFQRIEDGVALLADRIAEAGRERKHSRTSGNDGSGPTAETSGYSLAHDGFVPASAQEIVGPRKASPTVVAAALVADMIGEPASTAAAPVAAATVKIASVSAPDTSTVAEPVDGPAPSPFAATACQSAPMSDAGLHQRSAW